MRRRALAVCAGLLLLGLMPGATMAKVQANLDSSNSSATMDADIASQAPYYGFAQTFTIVHTGMLSGVELYLSASAPTSVNVEIDRIDGTGHPDGSEWTHGTNPVVGGLSWYYFSLASPFPVTAGQTWVIDCGACAGVVAHGTSASSYAGGYAMIDYNQAPTKVGWVWGVGLPSIADFGFMAFVDTTTPTLTWSHPQIVAGVSTPETLTATMTFTNGSEATMFGTWLGEDLPSWFTPDSPGITCSSQITTCTVEDFLMEIDVEPSGGTTTLTIVLTGTATAPAGTAGQTQPEDVVACVSYVNPDDIMVKPADLDPGCYDGSATLESVTALGTPRPTAPPTSTYPAPIPGGSGGTIWLLPCGVATLLCGLLALVTWRRWRPIA